MLVSPINEGNDKKCFFAPRVNVFAEAIIMFTVIIISNVMTSSNDIDKFNKF